MKTSIRHIFPIWFLLTTILPVVAFAGDLFPPLRIFPRTLQVQLTTSGYQCAVPENQPVASNVVAGFSACAVLQNRTPSDITFTFPTPDAASKHFTFRVFDSNKTLVWASDADTISEQVMTDATLTHGTTWRRMVHVPLRINDQALAAGVYTLEAVVDADKQPGASTVFEVTKPTPPADDTGINGLVLIGPTSPVAIDGQPNEAPLAGAFVFIEEIRRIGVFYIRPPFRWTGTTDENGRFHAVTPPGQFRVVAFPPYQIQTGTTATGTLIFPPLPIPFPRIASAEVSVEGGKFTDVTLHIDSGLRILSTAAADR